MVAIVLEVVLFVALLAIVGALVGLVLIRFTPLGLRLRQSRNRHQIDQDSELRCPIHGPQREDSLVRLPDGSRLCSECYKEAVHG